MKYLNKIISFLLICSCYSIFAQNEKQQITVKDYIETYKEIAQQNMKNFKIPASITLAQGILESANGNSDLAIIANNHFGIKCTSDWLGEKYYKDDDAKDECFRVYKAAFESFKDHSSFLTTRTRYASLFLLNITDYKAWAQGLKDAGYATNPKYPQLLIKIIEDNKLFELDSAYLSQNYIQSTENKIVKTNEIEDFEVVTIGNNNRKVFLNNNIKFILAKKGDNFYKIAINFEMKPGELYRYNDFSVDYLLKEGEKVYLQPKRRKGSAEFHVVKANETMFSISQLYGIKLKHLYKKNRLVEGTPAVVGDKLWLRKKKPL
ncbi:MAG: glucosaminidase domain-containing protein [Bacteroidetes bacterium]|nr:glucosaminidase domain-containing protein [Bacteroidota bacterium]